MRFKKDLEEQSHKLPTKTMAKERFKRNEDSDRKDKEKL